MLLFSGLKDDGLRSLCEILSASELAKKRLSVLRLGPPSDVPSFTIGTFSTLVQCMRDLSKLDVLEVKGLTVGQRESVSKVRQYSSQQLLHPLFSCIQTGPKSSCYPAPMFIDHVH